MKEHKFIFSFLLFLILNVVFYLVILFGHNLVPFNKIKYFNSAHHLFQDTRIENSNFNLIRDLGVWDGQWYLKIAEKGYPKNPTDLNMYHKNVMDGLTYAYFPLFPLAIKTVNFLTKNVEVSAFVLTNSLLIANFISLYLLLKKYFSEDIAVKANLLLWTFPIGVVFRAYYTENLFLFLLIWFVYFLLNKRIFLCAVFLGLLNITRGNAFFFYLLFAIFFLKISWKKTALALILSLVPLVAWLLFNFINTNDPFYFIFVRASWSSHSIYPFATLWYPFITHSVDAFFVIFFIWVFYKMAKTVSGIFFFVCLSLLIPPLIFFTVPFARSLICAFPLLIYPATHLKKFSFAATIIIQFFLLSLLGIFFINWHWIG